MHVMPTLHRYFLSGDKKCSSKQRLHVFEQITIANCRLTLFVNLLHCNSNNKTDKIRKLLILTKFVSHELFNIKLYIVHKSIQNFNEHPSQM